VPVLTKAGGCAREILQDAESEGTRACS